MFLTLPSLLAHMGWGVMRLYAKEASLDVSCGESSSGSGFYLKFAIHQSVEAHVWKKKESEGREELSSGEESCGDHDHDHGRAQSPRGDYSRPPVCLMAAGYITGKGRTESPFLAVLHLTRYDRKRHTTAQVSRTSACAHLRARARPPTSRRAAPLLGCSSWESSKLPAKPLVRFSPSIAFCFTHAISVCVVSCA